MGLGRREMNGLFEVGKEKLLYEGETTTILQVIPEFCHLIEYYLISKKLQWLLCEDHHDMLHLSGQPIIDRWMR